MVQERYRQEPYLRISSIIPPAERRGIGICYQISYSARIPLAVQAASLQRILHRIYPQGGRVEVYGMSTPKSLDDVISIYAHFIPKEPQKKEVV